MDRTSQKSAKDKGAGRAGDSREARLKAALKANIARRKAQARARASEGDGDNDENGQE